MSDEGSYPKREKFFSNRFVRAMTKVCVAQEIGPTAAWLLTVIVHTEDAAYYRRAVTYWDGQLAPLIGVSSQKCLAEARKKAVEAGWLHYEPGGKGRVARYWVLIPEHAEGLDDAPTDEGDSTPLRSKKDVATDSQREQNGNRTDSQPPRNGFTKGKHPIPIPIPIPNTDVPPIPENLQKVIDGWNSLSPGIAPKVAKPDSKMIISGWNRVMRDSEVSGYFDDVKILMDKIEDSKQLHGESYFRFDWLFAKGKDRITWNVYKIMDDRFLKPFAGTTRQATRGPATQDEIMAEFDRKAALKNGA